MANDNKHTALMGLENSIKNSGDLENNRYKNEAALRSPHEDDAALFDDIGNSVSAPGQRPRGLGANLAAGLSKGLAHGARTKATAEKKSKYEKHANVVNYLQQAQGEALKQNQWYEQEERRMETVRPFAVGGLEVAYSGMDYATGNERMRNIIEQAKIADPRIKGDYIGYVPNSPIVNLRTQDGEIIAYSLSNLAGEDIVKRVQADYVEKQRLHTAQDNVEVSKYDKGIGSGRYGSKMDESANQYGSVPMETLKKGGGGRAFMASINSEINLAKDIPFVLSELEKAEKIIADHPELGTGWNNVMSKGAFTKSALMDAKLNSAYIKLNKLSKRVAETYIKAKGSSITNEERAIIEQGLFDPDNPADANMFNIDAIRKELAVAAERGKFASEQLAKGLAATSESFNNYKKSLEQPTAGLPAEDDVWGTLGKAVN